MIKVIFFSQNSKFRVRNSHFSHRPKGKIRTTGTGFRSDRSQTTKPLALLDLRALSILARISAPPSAHSRTRIFPKPVLISETSSIHALQQISISIRETFPHKREVRPHSCRNVSLSRRADGSFRQSIVFRAEKRGAGRVGKTGCNRYLYPAGDTCGAARPAAGSVPGPKA